MVAEVDPEERRRRHREHQRRYRERHLQRVRESDGRYRQEHRDERNDYFRDYGKQRRADLKAQVFGHYGTTCACCGSAESLTIDHADGDGQYHRWRLFAAQGGVTVQLYRWLIREGFPGGFQALCLPCNSSKGTGEHCRLDHQAQDQR